MPWIKVDDHFDEHPKLARVGPPCWGYWLAGLAYCNRNLTDGFIPFSVAYNLAGFQTWDEPDDEGRELIWTYAVTRGMGGKDLSSDWIIERLLRVGLWEQVPGGYRVHDYLDYNPSKDSVLDERRKWADKKRSHRESRSKSNGESTGDSLGESERPVPVPVPVEERRSIRTSNSRSRARGEL